MIILPQLLLSIIAPSPSTFLIRKPKRKNKSTEKKANGLLHGKPFPSAQSLSVEALGGRVAWAIYGPVHCLMSLGNGRERGCLETQAFILG